MRAGPGPVVLCTWMGKGTGLSQWYPGCSSAPTGVGEVCPRHWLPLVPAHAGRKTSSMLEVDDEGGRMFLRVLLHLTMHDYPPLVSGALQLLFKHFSQRQEAMHTFKQVRGATSQLGTGRWACSEVQLLTT